MIPMSNLEINDIKMLKEEVEQLKEENKLLIELNGLLERKCVAIEKCYNKLKGKVGDVTYVFKQ